MNTKSKRPLLSFPKPKFTTGMIRLSITLLFSTLCIGSFGQKKSPITVETLLEEMTSYDEMTRYPALPYRSMQQSSYDRRHYPYMAHDLWQHTYNLAFLL